MTETTRFVSKRTALGILALVVAVVILLVFKATSVYEGEVRRDCMSSLSTPTPGTADYDEQSLLFASDVRECMRG